MGNLADALKGPRILTLDLERLPGEVTLDVWEPRDFRRVNYVHPDRWTVLPRTLSAAGKWHGSPRIDFVAAWENPDDPWHVSRTVAGWLELADIVVTFAGKVADLRWIRGDLAQAGLPLPTPWRDVDLYTIARRLFAYESKSLRHLCERLGLENKSGHYDAADAKAAMSGDPKAQARLRRYNRQDVKVTELVFDRLRAYVPGINFGLYYGTDGYWCCPSCGGTELEPAGFAATATTRYPAYRCTNPACGAIARGKHRQAAVPLRQPPR